MDLSEAIRASQVKGAEFAIGRVSRVDQTTVPYLIWVGSVPMASFGGAVAEGDQVLYLKGSNPACFGKAWGP